MEAWQIVLIVVAAVLILLILFAAIIWNKLPYIFAAKLTEAFKDDGIEKNPPDYNEYKAKVDFVKNLKYDSAYPDSGFDLYLPSSRNGEKLPLLFWVHGGGFVSGDKSGVCNLMTMIAAKGFAVMSINYAVAPKYKYPTAITQINEAFIYLKDKLVKQYPSIDTNKIFVGGDSAGGQLIAQYTAAATNGNLTEDMRLKVAVDKKQLKGIVLISAPLDIATMLPPVNKKLKLLSRVFISGYIGSFKLNKKKLLKQTTVYNHITPDFPPAFLTDGNTVSFEKHNRILGETLRKNGVKSEELYFDIDRDGKVNHEYIFDLREPRSLDAYDKIINFISSLI